MSQAETNAARDAGPGPMLSLLIAVGRWKWGVATIVGLGVAAAVATVVTLPRYYPASTVILPPQQQTPGMTALAQLNAIGSLTSAGGGVRSSDETYVALLRTRRAQDALVKQFKLQERYEAGSPESARLQLDDLTTISLDKKSGLITLTVEDRDPAVAVELANAAVAQLRRMLSELAITEAQQRRAFFESQAGKARDALNQAERVFRTEQAQSGLVVTQALAEAGVRSAVDLRSLIAAKEVQLNAASRFATPENPEVQRLAAELAALRRQLDKFEGGQGAGGEGTEKGGGAVKAYREMKYREAAMEALVRQLEIARLDESREGPLLQQVDAASASRIPSRPKRTLVVLLAAVLSLVVGSCIAVLRARAQDEDDDGRQWAELRRAWRLRAG